MRIEHPYGDLTSGAWLKGNLHTHSTFSDGKEDRQVVIQKYAEAKYDYLMMSDYDVYTSEQDYATCNDHGLVLIPGNELTRHDVHVLHVYAGEHVASQEDRQKMIDDVNKGRGFAIIAHPN
jgi:predicted metal-dependent phosphoesterase TrpH